MRAHPGVLVVGCLCLLLVDLFVGHLLDLAMNDRTASLILVVIVAVTFSLGLEWFARRYAPL